MDDKKKIFKTPKAELVSFPSEDIIVTSALVTGGDLGEIGTESSGEKESY